MGIAAIWGNDNNALHDGSSVKKAFRTISAARLAVPNLTLVEIYGGLYKEVIPLNPTIKGVGEVVILAPAVNSVFYEGRTINLENVTMLDFASPIAYTSSSSVTVIKDCNFIKAQYTGDRVFDLITTTSSSGPVTGSLIVNYDVLARSASIEQTTIIGGQSLEYTSLPSASSIIKDAIIGNQKIIFEFAMPIQNTLFADTCQFTFDDGNGNSVVDASFAAFKVANDANGWGFYLQDCDTEAIADTFVDAANGNYNLKPTSKAVNMSTQYGPIGGRKVGYEQKATASGWSNLNGFVLNGNVFEASGDADIEAPAIDFGKNSIVYAPDNSGLANDQLNGLVFDTTGNLDAPIFNGATQSGLNIALDADEVYVFEGAIEFSTNLRTVTTANYEAFIMQAGEVLQSVTSNITASVRKVNDYSGKSKTLLKWWKDGEAPPAAYKTVYRGEPILIDENGNANAEPSFDILTAQPVVARYIQEKPTVSQDYIKSA